MMVIPDKIQEAARAKEDENVRFRSYLKNHAEEEALDNQFLSLHKELFTDYDCSKCRNCCKMFRGAFEESEISEAADQLLISSQQFKDSFLQSDEILGGYETKNKPCDFLDEDGNCVLGDAKPQSCKDYPYTDQPGRLWSLYTVLNALEICPVVFEIYERLKLEYGFNNNEEPDGYIF